MGILTSYFLCNGAIRSLSVYNAIYNSICHAVSDTDPNNKREAIRYEMVVPKLYVFEIRNVHK